MRTKIRYSALALVLLALVTAGFVSAQERVAPEAPGGGAGIDATSGVMCLDATGCNDVILVYNTTHQRNYFSVTGWEYGCGDTGRVLDGAIRVAGGVAYIEYNFSGISYAETRLCHWNVQLALGSWTGPYSGACHYDSYLPYTGTMTRVPCPVSVLEAHGLDQTLGQ